MSQPSSVARCILRSLSATVLIVACLANPARAQSSAPGQNLIAPSQAIADLDQLHAALAEAHGAPYRFVSKQELETRYNRYRAAITQPITQFALLGYVLRMNADLGDGHARVVLDTASARRFAVTPLLPLRLRLEDGVHLIVVGDDSPDDTLLAPGVEVLSINGKSTRDIITTLSPLVPHDGFIASGRDARLARGFPTLFHQFVDQSTTFDITARSLSGATIRARLAGISDSARATVKNPVNNAYLTNASRLDGAKENITIRFPGDGSVGVLRIHGFVSDRFRDDLDSVMTLARTRGVRGMVLDLRGNGGGVDLDGAYLVSRFTDKPFRYFDRIHLSTLRPSFTTFLARTYAALDSGTTPDPAGGWLVTPNLHTGVSEQPAAATPFTGPLAVLMDGGTFSTAADVTATLRGLGKATFIGEESGGAYEGNTSGTSAMLTLTQSGIRVYIQMYGYVNAVPMPREHGRGTRADIEVPLRVRDILRGEDPGMAKALEVVRGERGKAP